MRKKLGRSINLVRPGEPPEAAGRCIFDERFPAHPAEKSRVLEGLISVLHEEKGLLSDSDENRARLCLDEALVNAIMHGSRNDSSKTVLAQAFILPNAWSVRVTDEGDGFRDEDLPDPDAPENLLEESGRGVHLMRSIMSDVSYWLGGRMLVMTRRTDKTPSSASAPAVNSERPKSAKKQTRTIKKTARIVKKAKE
jgi:serine/threonine-protein kinase RsbW